MRATSKLTTKYQATIPKAVREALNLERGDSVVFEVSDDGVVTLARATPLDLRYLEALDGTLSEWLSDNDDEAYGGL